jgi:hypothetical protein
VAEPKDIDQAEPGDLIQAATRNPWGRIEPAWLLFMKMLPRADARRIAREEGGRAVCYDHARQRFAVLVPQIEE